MDNSERECGGCPHLIWEQWPKGAAAARCMSAKQNHYGRTLQVNPSGNKSIIYRPAWCGEKEEE